MAKLKIDRAGLFMALDWQGDLISYYLDKQTGEIILLSEDTIDVEDVEEEAEKMDDQPDRYAFIEPIPSHEAFHWMEEFIPSVSNFNARVVLSEAISHGKPFRKFKDAVAHFPEVQDAWYAFHDQCVLQWAIDWLKSEGVDADLVDSPQGG